MDSDFLLLQKMKMGDEQAIGQFVRKYYPKILKYCCLHIRDGDYARDITQDTFERFFRSLPGYRHYGKAENYLYVIAANGCRDYYRKMRELPEAELGDLGEASALSKNPGLIGSDGYAVQSGARRLGLSQMQTAPDSGGFDIELKIDVQNALEELPKELREAAVLYYFQGLKQKEIAKILGVGLPLVKYRLKKAKERLAVLLEKEEFL